MLSFGCCLILFTSISQVVGFCTSQVKIVSEMTYNVLSRTLNPTLTVSPSNNAVNLTVHKCFEIANQYGVTAGVM